MKKKEKDSDQTGVVPNSEDHSVWFWRIIYVGILVWFLSLVLPPAILDVFNIRASILGEMFGNQIEDILLSCLSWFLYNLIFGWPYIFYAVIARILLQTKTHSLKSIKLSLFGGFLGILLVRVTFYTSLFCEAAIDIC
jgi:hypothetical protein